MENHECNSDVLHLCFVSTLKVSEQRRVWLDQQSIPPSLTGNQKTVLKVSHEGKRKTKMWSLTLNHTQKINSSCNVKGSKYENILIDENREEEIYNYPSVFLQTQQADILKEKTDKLDIKFSAWKAIINNVRKQVTSRRYAKYT